MKLFYQFSFALIFIISSCTNNTSLNISKRIKKDTLAPIGTKNVREYSIQAVMWQQNAAEYKALCHQAYSWAKIRLDELMKLPENNVKNLAIITDIDETALDNSPFNAKLVEKNEHYTAEEWNNWVNQIEAKAVPGAIDFFNYAKSKGVEVFYVSNRLKSQTDETLKNLQNLGFPYTDTAHIALETTTGDKKARFDQVKAEHKVILYLGDNLSDFNSGFRAHSTQERNQLEKELKNHFGVDYIVLPNPMYGDWQSKGIYQGKHDWTQAQLDSLQRASLRSY